jgi:molybdopterin synthase sulfur carrier subunit
MPSVRFTPNLQRHVACPPCEVEATTVRAALEAVFADNPKARSYVLEDHGGLRKHMLIFVDGAQIQDRDALSDTVSAGAEIYVMQALSGG